MRHSHPMSLFPHGSWKPVTSSMRRNIIWIFCAPGDSHERVEVVSYLLADGRLDKLKETVNGRDAA